MTKFFNKFKKTLFLAHFWSIFQFLGAKKFYLENPVVACTSSFGFLRSCQNLGKTNDAIAIKCPDRRKNGRKEGRLVPFRLQLGSQKEYLANKRPHSLLPSPPRNSSASAFLPSLRLKTKNRLIIQNLKINLTLWQLLWSAIR